MPKIETWVRAAIAVFVVLLTFLMTRDQPVRKEQIHPMKKPKAVEAKSPVPAIPKEVETIFVLVVGYYFAERKKVEPLRVARAAAAPTVARDEDAALGEVRLQFAFALALIIATLALFFGIVKASDGQVIGYRLAIDTAWVAGVALGVAFFFRKTDDPSLDRELSWYRGILALLIVAVAVAMYFLREQSVPLQWLSLVLVVITFYFAERK